jgi:NAD(P)-dependent dehydrogenase (short-subunit alcohol dehydrogenase family)
MSDQYPMLGKIVLVTGATSGIGEAVATRLYELGAHVILHGRSATRVAATMDHIQKNTRDHRTGRLDILTADFAVMAQVYDMAEALKKRYDRLDVLINNAGAFFLRRQETPDGFEKTFAVNYLAHFLLTTRLMDLFKASASARVITVSSDAHHQARLSFKDLMLKEKYQGFMAYANSKLCGVLLTYELARRFRRTPNQALISNAMNPGFVATRIGKDNGWLVRLALGVYQRLPMRQPRPRTPEEGADTVIYLAMDPQAAAFNGKYFMDREVKATSVPSYDHDVAAHLWGISEVMIRQCVPALQAPQEQQEIAFTVSQQSLSQPDRGAAPLDASPLLETDVDVDLTDGTSYPSRSSRLNTSGPPQ